MSYNIKNILSKEVFDSIPTARAQREATENYEKVLKEEVKNLVNETKYQIEKSVRSGQFSAVVEIKPNELSAWSSIDLKYFMKPILADLGYKVRFPNEELYKFIIEW